MDLTPAIKEDIKRQAQIGAATTLGAMAGVLLAKNTGWNKTITIAATSFVGLAIGVSAGLIDKN